MINYSGSGVLTKIFQLIKSKFDSLAAVATSGSYKDLKDTPDIGEIIKGSVEVTTETSTINIPFTASNVDNLMVYLNGLLLIKSLHYTATTTNITLNNFTAHVGDVFTFINSTVAPISLENSADNIMLVDVDNNYTGISTVEGALKYLMENGTSDIKSISLNNATLDPDSNGNVNIPITIPIKSITVNGTVMTPDANGKVSITVAVSAPIKSLFLNGSEVAPDDSGKIELSNIMVNNEDQTMQAKLVAQNNDNYSTKQVRNIFLMEDGSDLPTGADGDICLFYSTD